MQGFSTLLEKWVCNDGAFFQRALVLADDRSCKVGESGFSRKDCPGRARPSDWSDFHISLTFGCRSGI